MGLLVSTSAALQFAALRDGHKMTTASDWIAGASFLVSAYALLQVQRIRIGDRRTELLRDIANLRPKLEALERSMPDAVRSRVNVNAATGLGRSGAEKIFLDVAEADLATVRELRGQLDEIARVPWLAGYGRIEAKLVAARTLRTRFEQIAEKYVAAGREDEAKRQQIRENMTARAARLGLPPPKPD